MCVVITNQSCMAFVFNVYYVEAKMIRQVDRWVRPDS